MVSVKLVPVMSTSYHNLLCHIMAYCITAVTPHL